LVVLESVIPKEEHNKIRPISKFNILYFFYITIGKIQEKYYNTKKNSIITSDSLYNTIKNPRWTDPTGI
jgi:hypothetical protein